MRKKLIVLIIILVSIVLVKSMMETTEKNNEVINTGPQLHTTHPKSNVQLTIEKSQDNLTEFQDELNRHFKELPTIGDLKNLTAEEVHYTPEIIKEGGGIIGRVFDEAEKDPSIRPAAMSFFKKCAEDQEIAIAIRAMCLNKVLSQVPKWQIPMSVTDAEISEEVFDLAMKLPR